MRAFSLVTLLGLAVLPLAAQSDDDNLTWLDNYQEAIREAKLTGKPIFLEYRCEP